ncbi:alpha/beta hydrolase [Saccharopolyspora sp. HNM0983]|uniref:Alpha/beta hydrolase n=1 Tax=Saccharopolyspora montiporae TaxID=2781240 RepID=A0A929G1Z3_9PSEU|nr:alpha/beta hydrolase [Saccharopolyspora sp. HNM0983]
MPAAAVNGIRTAYREAGAGPPVVLVHGLGEDGTSWRTQQDALTDRRTIAPDLRGHGASGLGEPDGTWMQLRDDLLGFLQQVSGPATCVGFSLGGVLVLAAAAERPDLVPSAVTVATSAVVGRSAAEFYTERARQVRAGDRDAVLDSLRTDTAAMLNGGADPATAWRKRAAAIGAGEGYANAAAAMAGLREHPLAPRLGEISGPVEVIGAEHDRLCPRKAADILLESLPRSRYHEIAGSGHLVHADAPEQLTDLLNRLLPQA